MITLSFKYLKKKLNICNEVKVKSISAAWNQLRNWRDMFENSPSDLDGAILSVNIGNERNAKIPEEILFKMNKKGKIEFKDFSKIKKKDKEDASPFEKTQLTLNDLKDNEICLVTKSSEINMKKILNPLF